MIAHFDSPIGCLVIKSSDKGVTELKKIERPAKLEAGTGYAAEAKQQLKAYFAGERKEFDLPLDWSGCPEFQQRVWTELLKIPYGHTISYGAIAEALGDKNASRAVGSANRNNKIAIIVPCHRVIAKTGHLHGYFYGLDVKRQLLQLENPRSFATQGSLF